MRGIIYSQCKVTNYIKQIVDLANQLAEKAVGELNYEIDTEVCNLLIDNAAEDADLTWSKTLPIGVNSVINQIHF